jgi:hypothetical protein
LLKGEDFDCFVALLKEVEKLDHCTSTRSIEELLSCEEGGITNSDFSQLSKSLRIAAVAGDICFTAADIADHIRQNVQLDRYIDLSSTENWMEALNSALNTITTRSTSTYFSSIVGREENVGNACRSLRQAGYPVTIDAFGCQIDERTVGEITSRINVLVRIVGGLECLNQIFCILREQKRYHDGFWLFGDQIPNVTEFKTPTLPYAWLARLALQNLSKRKQARKPDVAWKNLTELATHFAACYNFERYSQWENFDLQPGDLGFLFARSAGWQQLFMLKQVPVEALQLITHALREKLSYADLICLTTDISCLSTELKNLVAGSEESSLSIVKKLDAIRAFPTLWAEFQSAANLPHFSNPFDPKALSHEDQILFEYDGDKILILPRSLAAAAACNFLFGLIWQRIEPTRAALLVGEIFERVIELACTSKATSVYPDINYAVSKNLQPKIDLTTVSDNHVIFFEVKAKSLTNSARSGDTIKFLTDYANSYLSILKQLVRHERYFRAGVDMSPLTIASDKSCLVTKIAVSPLSYGPVGDRILANGIVSSLSRATLTPIVPNPENEKALAKLSSKAKEILTNINKFCDRKNGSIDLHSYMIDVFWLDIGELIYMLGRADSVTNALAPLKHITFSSRDIWTEIANADRLKLTEKYWRPLAT